MHWLGGASYIATGVVSVAHGRTPTLAFIAIALTIWLAVVVRVESRAITPEVADPNGWSGALTVRATETAQAIRQLALYAAWMRMSLIFFSFLLMTWTLLP